jgi:hypothetical protein
VGPRPGVAPPATQFAPLRGARESFFPGLAPWVTLFRPYQGQGVPAGAFRSLFSVFSVARKKTSTEVTESLRGLCVGVLKAQSATYITTHWD